MEQDTVIAAFDNANDARSAVDALVNAGISRSSIEMQPPSDTTDTTTSKDAMR